MMLLCRGPKGTVPTAGAAPPERAPLELHVVPMYAALSPERQARVFHAAPPGTRKVPLPPIRVHTCTRTHVCTTNLVYVPVIAGMWHMVTKQSHMQPR